MLTELTSWIPEAFIPLAIFLLRAIDLTLATLRMLFTVQGRRRISWVLGFLQASIFVISASLVLGNLDNLLNILAFAGGFAGGNVAGMIIEGWIIPGYTLIRIISPNRGTMIADNLRKFGHGVTEIAGRGRGGTVNLLYCYVLRKDVQSTENEILKLDQDAFLTIENVRQLSGGWLS
jgi:uncharacterized protein YebE (UPF0316 family)